jgi:hypothetical protein
MIKWLFRRSKSSTAANQFRDSIGIDVSGPEFFDLYPTKLDFARRIATSGLFRNGDVDWIAAILHRIVTAGAGERTATDAVIRSGQELDETALVALGLHRKMKIGRRFVAALSANDVGGAIDHFRFAVRATMSRANQLHNLRRGAEAGVTQWRFSSPKDQRCTALEEELEGKRMSLEEARSLIIENGDQITRSTFIGLVNL